jgi:hypothetical protein
MHRVEKITQIINAHYPNESNEEGAIDLLTDLLHFYKRRISGDFYALIDTALLHLEAETGEGTSRAAASAKREPFPECLEIKYPLARCESLHGGQWVVYEMPGGGLAYFLDNPENFGRFEVGTYKNIKEVWEKYLEFHKAGWSLEVEPPHCGKPRKDGAPC